MKSLLLTAMMVALACTAAASQQLLAVSPADEAALSAAREVGASVRHVGQTGILVGGTDALAASLEWRGVSVRALPEPRAGGRLYLSYPRYSAERLSEAGDVLWWEDGGAAIVACAPEDVDRLRALSFSSYPLPESMEVGSWFDNTPPAHLRARTSEDERAVRGVVRDVMESVSEDSLMAHVRRLSENAGGEPRSRFVYRDECLTDAKAYIMDRLSESLPAPAYIDTQRFILHGYTCEEGLDGPIIEYPADNIVGVLPGTGRLSGYYVVCAHYDATAVSTPFGDPTEAPWFWWCETAAPGADDNATGVATVLEAARALSDLSFPFDIRFILFSGEELGLHGSYAYADSAAGYRMADEGYTASPDTIYGVLNVDMIAYKPDPAYGDTCHIVTNPGSAWLADWVIDTAQPPHDDLFPEFEALRIDKSLAYSDHAPFWAQDYDALVAIEHWNPRDRNPTYHTTADIADSVYPSQLLSVARMMTGAVARMAYADAGFNLAVFDDDVVLYATTAGGTEYHTDHFEIGKPAPIRVDFHAFGPDGTADVTLEVWDGAPGGGELLSSADFSGTMGGGEVLTHEFEWDLEADDLGEHLFSVRLVVTGDEESSLSDNIVQNIPVRVDSPDLFLVDHFVWPNPAGGSDELNVSYQLSRGTEGSVSIKVFDLLGQELADRTLYYSPNPATGNDGLMPGLNSVGWENLNSDGVELASGIYVYQITLTDRGGSSPVGQVMGKFAVVR